MPTADCGLMREPKRHERRQVPATSLTDDNTRSTMSVRRRLLVTGLYLVALLVLGTAGYMIVEGWSAFDALYQTTITVTTIGFGEVHPLSTAGRLFTMVLILGGVGGAAYALSTSVQLAVEGQLGEFFGRRRMRHHIESMQDHAIICGFGRVGQEIALELHERGAAFVVVESDPAAGARSGQLGYDHIDGNATDDDVLVAAGIARAASLLAASDSDTDNTYIVLSARTLRPSLYIVARASSPQSEAKLMRAGADRVISPYRIAGQHMAMAALHPAMVDFVATGQHRRDGDVILADLTITADSPLAGRMLGEVLNGRGATTALGVRRDGTLRTEPAPTEILEAGDQLILIGPATQVEALAGTGRRGQHFQQGAR
jgi:voltage-gated potassium channel